MMSFCSVETEDSFDRVNYDNDAGTDIECDTYGSVEPGETKRITITNRFIFPEGFKAIIYPRCCSAEKGLFVHSTVINPNFTGKLFIMVTNLSKDIIWFSKGDRFAQLIFSPLTRVSFIETKKFMTQVVTIDRGASGFGTTGFPSVFQKPKLPSPQKHTVNNKFKLALKSSFITKGFHNFQGDWIQWYTSPDMQRFTEEMVETIDPCHIYSLPQFVEHINMKIYECYIFTILRKYDGLPMDCVPFVSYDVDNNEIKFSQGIFQKPKGGVLYHYIKVGPKIAKFLNINSDECLKPAKLTGVCSLKLETKDFSTHATFQKLKLMCNIAEKPLYEYEYKNMFKAVNISELQYQQISLHPDMKRILFWFEDERGNKVSNFDGNLMFVLKFKEY
ncbi:deoxyuridine 5'-triphosphate nucleotidohydrolase-like protein [Leptotrombidium deliense]|uniref:Deoxyuridine 5'-triphosphate nucleotidohydrolase n=1 Tax=Leptotrombidium deliense TaxID=299467 RepID=A0A443S0Q0_9ACAR|nr:deoxyuridine 5'-triphosphate nucleotidohydrolase-like protein [Leptotrombidium deliense]